MARFHQEGLDPPHGLQELCDQVIGLLPEAPTAAPPPEDQSPAAELQPPTAPLNAPAHQGSSRSDRATRRAPPSQTTLGSENRGVGAPQLAVAAVADAPTVQDAPAAPATALQSASRLQTPRSPRPVVLQDVSNVLHEHTPAPVQQPQSAAPSRKRPAQQVSMEPTRTSARRRARR